MDPTSKQLFLLDFQWVATIMSAPTKNLENQPKMDKKGQNNKTAGAHMIVATY